jgi:thiamine-phosphate pyrophosphorylase
VIPRLCYISDADRGSAGRPLADVIGRLFRGGVGLVVLRERTLSDAEHGTLIEDLEPLRVRGLRLVVSRRLDLARGYGLDGVHLARDAVPVREARAWLGAEALIGYSAHAGGEARAAAAAGASYVTLSPIYPTESKPGAPGRGLAWLAEAVQGLPVPALALGGITPARTGDVRRAGAWGVAAVSALGADPDPERAAAAFARALAEETP